MNHKSPKEIVETSILGAFMEGAAYADTKYKDSLFLQSEAGKYFIKQIMDLIDKK